MLGHRSSQLGMFTADQQYLRLVGEDSFYGFLARHGRDLFRDEDFAALYCPDNGRGSVPPSLLCIALLLQTHDRASDAEAAERAIFDLRWKVALGLDLEARPFAKSTLQLFRSQLIIHEQAGAIFKRSLALARQTGLLKGRKMRAAVDTTVIFGRGAVEDTYNLIGEGIVILCRALASPAGEEADLWAACHDLGRFFGSSIKTSEAVDWDDAASRESFLDGLIRDGERCLQLAREARAELEAGSVEDERIRQAADLLTQLLWQDVEPTERGHRIREGTAEGRVPSAHDPEQRHGRKSHGKTFTGYKGGIAVDVETGLITAVDVVAGNASDGEHAVGLVESSEANSGSAVEQVIGDTAYGSMDTRAALGEREVIAPTVKPHCGRRISKDDFAIDVAHDRVRCPMGHETTHWTWAQITPGKGKPKLRVKRFAFPKELCRICPRYAECVTDKRRRGRFVTLHPDEERLQAARAFERTDYFREQYRQRVVVEHRIARLVQLGIRQSRFFGREKTLFQLLMATAVANLTLIAGHDAAARSSLLISALSGLVWASLAARGLTQRRWGKRPARFALARRAKTQPSRQASVPSCPRRKAGCRPGF
jgi:hypothetical protein